MQGFALPNPAAPIPTDRFAAWFCARLRSEGASSGASGAEHGPAGLLGREEAKEGPSSLLQGNLWNEGRMR